MHKLTGYTDRWGVKQGAAVRFHVTSAGGAPFELRFVRFICADPNPEGPGYEEVAMASPVDGTVAGLEQGAWTGSFGQVDGLVLPPGAISLRATVWPTTPAKGVQGVVALALPGWRMALCIGPGGGAMAEATGPGGVVRAEVPAKLAARRWYDLVATLGADGSLTIEQAPHRALRDAGRAEARSALPCPGGAARGWIAALPPSGDDPRASAFCNGKIEDPAVWAGAPGTAQPGAPGLVAGWDFSVGIPTQLASDIGPQAAHARLVNLPARAMTGSNWTGAVHDWKSDPSQYGAIHFHDDDQGDLGWKESFALTVPMDWPSGFYAAHIRNDAGEDYIPFFVRPAKPASGVAFLVPTFSYQVYGNFVREGRGAEIRERAAARRALLETPDMNPQYGLSCYNHHSDGSGVSLVSMFRPQLDTRPRQMLHMDPAHPHGSGTQRIVVDSYFIQWLTREGIAHDVVTDHDLHEEGVELLRPYRVLIAAQHPEYHSERMMQALEDFLSLGGRMMYLGGNGFYWRAEPSEHAPGALEVRRAESGIRVWETLPGESYNQFGGGYGGLWRRIGRPAHKLVGSGFSCQGLHRGFPYRFTDGIHDPRVDFMREGLSPEVGQAFGERGHQGGGAAGHELDSVNFKYGSPEHTLVVAKGIVIHPDYGWVNEDMLTHVHPLPHEDWACADLLFFETPAGGAVFSVGSMTWAGAMPIPGTLRTLTTNVLRRFMDPKPFALPG
jgi:N,N-dimethylformamidase